MNTLKFNLCLFLFTCCVNLNACSLADGGATKYDTLYGYLDNNDSKDFLIKRFQTDAITIDIFLKGESGFKKVASKSFKSDMFSDEEYFKNVDVFNDVKGGISILGFCCGTWKTVETHYYQYNDQAKTWILNKTYQYSYKQDFSLEYEVEYPKSAISISGNEINTIKVLSLEDRKSYYSQLLPTLLQKLATENQKKIKNSSFKQYPKYMALDMMQALPISDENVQLYNDIAYYLQQTTTEDINAQYILEEVIRKFPERVVAYINVGDAYWELKKTDKAKEAYNKYIDLMKKSGKETKIPQRILERIK